MQGYVLTHTYHSAAQVYGLYRQRNASLILRLLRCEPVPAELAEPQAVAAAQKFVDNILAAARYHEESGWCFRLVGAGWGRCACADLGVLPPGSRCLGGADFAADMPASPGAMPAKRSPGEGILVARRFYEELNIMGLFERAAAKMVMALLQSRPIYPEPRQDWRRELVKFGWVERWWGTGFGELDLADWCCLRVGPGYARCACRRMGFAVDHSPEDFGRPQCEDRHWQRVPAGRSAS